MDKIISYILIAATLTIYSCYGNGDQGYNQTEERPTRQVDVWYDVKTDSLNDTQVEAKQTDESTGEGLRETP